MHVLLYWYDTYRAYVCAVYLNLFTSREMKDVSKGKLSL